MYEDAMELIDSRSADIQNDRKILDVLSTSSLSIPEAWDRIVHIRNGSIRHSVCCSFLKEKIGDGEVRQAGDVRVVYSIADATISIPGSCEGQKQILVSLDRISSLVDCPNTKKEKPSREEEELGAYISLLKHNAPIPERVRLRDPDIRAKWSDFTCCLYYFFILHPADIFQGKSELDYWEALQATERMCRKEREREAWAAWNAQRNNAAYFKKEIYPSLLPFKIPIFIRLDGATIPADKFFSLSGC